MLNNFLLFLRKPLLNLLLCLLLSGIIATATAQTSSFGVKYGLNTSNFAGDLYVNESGDDTYKWINRENIGVSVTYSRSKTFALTFEFNYVNIGSDFQSITARNILERKIQLTYLEFPVLAKIFFLQGKKVKPNIFIGPSINFLFVAIEDIEERSLAGLLIREIKNKDVWNEYNPYELSLITGYGVNLSIGKGFWLNIDFRFSYGLTDITQNSNLTTKQNTFTVNTAVTIPY